MKRILISLLLVFGFCYSQDSTAIMLKLDELIKLHEQVVTQVIKMQVDLRKIEYATFVLSEMLKPTEEVKELEVIE